MIKLIERANDFSGRVAIRSDGRDHNYEELLESSAFLASELLNGASDLKESRIAFIVLPGFEYVRIQWAIWRAGGIAVPLCVKHPLASIRYVIEDTAASCIIYSGEFKELITPLMEEAGIRFIKTEDVFQESAHLPEVDMSRRAMILYTSGTTGSPKGVVTTHKNIEAQITSLTSSWEWSQNDHILNILPMHHVHGIINVLSCALWSGAVCEFLPAFDEESVFRILSLCEVNIFMAVPTIYFKLISYWKTLPPKEQESISVSLASFRLMVSGSAALPVILLEEWKEISGHILLERYGMTEMGMAISNPYRGERRPGYIGQALPGLKIRLADEKDQVVTDGSSGEIQIKGPNVFCEYWNKPEETRLAFSEDGWFRSGDIAEYEKGSYKILGRNSVDIIKSGGYKISALEIEEVLRSHADIMDCGVIGIPDLEWGEIVGAGLILQEKNFDLDSLKIWMKERLPGYKCPRRYLILGDLPRNVMGKVTKNELKDMFIE